MLNRPYYVPKGLTPLESKAIDSLLAELDRADSIDLEESKKREQQKQHLQKVKALAEEWGELKKVSEQVMLEMVKCSKLLVFPKIFSDSYIFFSWEKLNSVFENQFSDSQAQQLFLNSEIILLLEKLISIAKEERLLLEQVKEFNKNPEEPEEKSHEENINQFIAFITRALHMGLVFGITTKEQYDETMSSIADRARSSYGLLREPFRKKGYDLFWRGLSFETDYREEITKFNKTLSVVLGFEAAPKLGSESKSTPVAERKRIQGSAPPPFCTIWRLPQKQAQSQQVSHARLGSVRWWG